MLIKHAKEFVLKTKLDIGNCLLCKRKVVEENACAFDFDHKDPFLKTNNISYMAKSGQAIEVIALEIKNCRMLCASNYFVSDIFRLSYETY